MLSAFLLLYTGKWLMTTLMFPERPVVSVPRQEDSLKQEFSGTMVRITDVFEQIQILCAENEIAKNLFESADNWSMPLKSRLQFLRDLLEDDQHAPSFKNTLATKTLASLQTILTTLREQVAQGNRAQVIRIKEAKEALDRLFGTESLS